MAAGWDINNMFGQTDLQEPGEVSGARQRLVNAADNPIKTPTREVEGLDPIEQAAIEMAEAFSQSGPNKDRGFAMDKAKEWANGQDPTEMPEFKAFMERMTNTGDQMLRNSSRGLGKQGNDPLSSSKGRDALGRQADDTQGAMVSAAIPFFEAERGRQFASIGLVDHLATMEDQDKLQKIEVGDRAGTKLRTIRQMVLDESYNKQINDIQQQNMAMDRLSGVVASNPGGYQYEPGWYDRARQFTEDVQGDLSHGQELRESVARTSNMDSSSFKNVVGGMGSMMGGG